MRSGDVCLALDLPSSTLRYYTRVYSEFLSPTAKQPKRRDYTPQDVAILGQVMQLAGSGVVIADIKTKLRETVDIQGADDVTTALTLPGIIHKLDGLYSQLAQQSSDIETLKTQVEQLASALEVEHKKSRWDRFWGK